MNQVLHYILTAQWTDSTGAQCVATNSGTIRAGLRTRDQIFSSVFTELTTQLGAPPARTSVLYFSLEPNAIGQAA